MTGWDWALITIAMVAALAGSVFFLFGDTLFGSDPATIDSYNEEVLASCDVPSESTLVRTFVLSVYDSEGRVYRSLSHIYAVPAEADEVIAFYGLPNRRDERPVAQERACRFGQRPLVLVVAMSDTPLSSGVLDTINETESTNVDDLAELPPDTQTLLRLRLAQRENEGVL